MADRGSYPGYRRACNGCGLCCLSSPCAVSQQFKLWIHGRCKALVKLADKYVCGVIRDPQVLDPRLARTPLDERLSAIGVGHGCDHRAAWSVEEALQLLAARNITDDMMGNPNDSYPRACMLHVDGETHCIFLASKGGEPTIIPVTPYGMVWDQEQLLRHWRPHGR